MHQPVMLGSEAVLHHCVCHLLVLDLTCCLLLLLLLLLPGLRALQGRQQLQDLVTFVKTTRDNLDWGPGGPPPLLVKIAPDVSDADKADIAAVVAATAVDGLVVGNTTISRPGEGGADLVACSNMWLLT
jgi:hypothetical protein